MYLAFPPQNPCSFYWQFYRDQPACDRGTRVYSYLRDTLCYLNVDTAKSEYDA